ncbi:condensation domain-containing protein, partial [Thauera sinica]
QEGILFHHLMAEDGDPYLLPSVFGFSSREMLDAFLARAQQVIDRHDILRTAVIWEGLAKPMQVVLRDAPLMVEELHFDPAGGNVLQQLEAYFDPRRTRIAVDKAPMLRVHVAEDAANGRWLLHLLAHHLTIDHTASDLIIEETRLIEQGRADELQPPAAFREFVAQALYGVSQEEHETFFRDMLGDIDEPTAPFGLLDVQGDGHDIGEAKHLLPRELSGSLRQQARQLGVSTASLMHLAWALVVARATGREDVVFGTVLFGRMQGGHQADRSIGIFINTLPLRVTIGGQTARSGAKHVHTMLARLLRHEHAPLAVAQRYSGVASPAPLFTSLLNYRYSPQQESGLEGVGQGSFDDIEALGVYERTNYPVTLDVDDLGEDFLLTAQVSRTVEAERVCAFMAEALHALSSALSSGGGTSLNALDVLPSAEREQVVSGWNATAKPYPLARCVHELFESQAARTPQAPAVRFGGESLGYGELNARANRLAHHLASLGVGPEVRVALCVERGFHMVTGLLAVLKAGGAYVPLDPAYPGDRLAYMLADSE